MMMQTSRRYRVIVVEDNTVAQRFYRAFFDAYSREYEAVFAFDGESALEEIEERGCDVAIVDWELPGMDGVDVVRSIRSHASNRGMGILIVTVKSEAADCASILESGADDFMTKPCDPRVLLARLRSIIRRRRPEDAAPTAESYRIGGLSLDVSSDRVSIGGRAVRLNPKEFELLKLFLRRPGMLHASRYLWDQVWGYESRNWDHTLIATLSSLRKKIGVSGWARRLESHKGKGYILNHH